MSIAIEILKRVHDEKSPGATYMAGTLAAEGFALHNSCYNPIKGMFDEGAEQQKYNDEEKYWWSKCYLKYKTPNHSFYQEAHDHVAKYGPTITKSTNKIL